MLSEEQQQLRKGKHGDVCALERFRSPAAVGGAPVDPRVTAWLACDPLAPLAMLGPTSQGNQRPSTCPSTAAKQSPTGPPVGSERDTDTAVLLLVLLVSSRVPSVVLAGVGRPAALQAFYPTSFHGKCTGGALASTYRGSISGNRRGLPAAYR